MVRPLEQMPDLPAAILPDKVDAEISHAPERDGACGGDAVSLQITQDEDFPAFSNALAEYFMQLGGYADSVELAEALPGMTATRWESRNFSQNSSLDMPVGRMEGKT